MQAEYDVLVDGFRGGVGEEYVNGLVWVYRPGERVQIYAGSAFSTELARAGAQLNYGREEGFTEDQIWAYLSEEQVLNGYTSLRTARTEIGGSALEVGVQVLHDISEY